MDLSSDIPADELNKKPQLRAKSKSISNAALQHRRLKQKKALENSENDTISPIQHERYAQASPSPKDTSIPPLSHNPINEAPKRVAFHNLKTFQIGADSNNNSITSSEDENYDEEDEEDEKPKISRSNSRKIPLRKLVSAPLTYSHSLASQLMSNQHNDSYSNLPVFNKRPLTDTPIVSSVASPESRTESEDDFLGRSNDLSNKLKNISHLSLSELNDSVNQHSHLDSKDLKKDPLDLSAVQEVDPIDSSKVGVSSEVNKEKIDTKSEPKEIAVARKRLTEKLSQELKNLLQEPIAPPPKKAYTINIPGQTSSKVSPDGRIASVDVGSKLVIVMVGLPARGKSYITNKLTRYLNWLQHDCRVFNVGNTRRKDVANNVGPEANPLPDTKTPNNETQDQKTISPSTSHTADFFSPDNKNTTAIREKWAMDTLDSLLNYVIDGPGSVGIFDATNSTKKRRSWVLKRIQERSKGELKVLFLESICSDPAILESNIRLKLSGPDYRNMDPEVALRDFVGRLHNYEKAYETIDESEEDIPGFQYVKMIDVGKKVVSYNIQGFLASQTIYFLLNFNLCERQIWITRHGESEDNLTGRIGGDSHLTKRGLKFSRALSKFMEYQRKQFRKEQLKSFSTRLELKYSSYFGKDTLAKLDSIPSEPNFCVWTSMLCRAVETGQYFDDKVYSVKEMRMLNELGGGKFEGMTYEEIQNKYPKEYQSRIQNKLNYRYPGVGGESYLDVLTRLRPLITEIERTTDNLLLISHRVVLRILLAYFLNLDKNTIGELDVPLHTLYCLESKPYGTDYRMYEFDEDLDWFRKVEPDHQKNVKEVGVEFRERKYSVVPTAPPSSQMHKSSISASTSRKTSSAFNMRRSHSFGAKEEENIAKQLKQIGTTPTGEKKTADLKKLRGA